MGYLLQIFLALGVVALDELGIHGEMVQPLAVLPLLALPHLLGGLVRRLSMGGRFRAAALVHAALGWSPIAIHAIAILLMGARRAFVEWTAAEEELVSWPGPQLFLELAPFVAGVVLAADARARLEAADPITVRRLRGFQLRMFLSGLVPLGLFLLVSGIVGASDGIRVRVEEIGLFNAGFAAFLLLLFGLLMPAILSLTWDTVPLDRSALRTLLEDVAERSHFRYRSLRVWRTGGAMANAAILGFMPWHRVILFTDALLAQLSPRELISVLGHEMGHAIRHHVLAFAAWTGGFFLTADLLASWLGDGRGGTEAAVFATALLLWYWSFGYLSRRYELDADLTSVEVTGDPAPLLRALDRLGGLHSRRRSSWRHFSTAERSLFLRAAMRHPDVSVRMRRSLRRWGMMGTVLLVVSAALELRRLVADLPEDRVRAYLVLGDYAAAVNLGPGLEDGSLLETLAAQAAQLAAEHPDESPLSIERLVQAARDALSAGEMEQAVGFLDLAGLRGAQEPRAAAEAMRLAREGALEEARALVRSEAPDWEAHLDPHLRSVADSPGADGR